MPDPNPQALEFLQTRRSRPMKTLQAPVPNREELIPILTAAARVPDHGKLEPWRFIVLDKAALARLSDTVAEVGAAEGMKESRISMGQFQYREGNLAVAVIEVQRESSAIPDIEQTYSAGAACLSLLNAALAAGWGANWLSGWASHNRTFMEKGLGLEPHERIAGIIHIGTESAAPPERPRPDMESIVTWPSA